MTTKNRTARRSADRERANKQATEFQAAKKKAKVIKVGRSRWEVRYRKNLFGGFSSKTAAIEFKRELKKQTKGK